MWSRSVFAVLALGVVASCSPPAPPLTITPESLPDGILDMTYSVQFEVSDGKAPYTFSLAAGDLPTGLALSGEGLLTGRPLTASSSHFTVRATDSTGRTGDREYDLAITPTPISVAPARLVDAIRGAGYLAQLSASGGNGPYVFALTGGALPDGLTLNPQGIVAGRATMTGSSTFTVRATDLLGRTGEGTHQITVIDPSVELLPATLPDGIVGLDYDLTLTGTGGIEPYTFALDGGTLPSGLTLTPGGVVSGRPLASGAFDFMVSLADADGNLATRARRITIADPAVLIAPATLPITTVGVPFSQQFTATGGMAPYTWSLSIGVLPPGLTLTADGLLSGTPTSIITTSLNVTVTDSLGASGTRSLTLQIDAATITISPPNLPAPSRMAAYSQQLTAAGGTAPYLFTLNFGGLPAGLSLSSSGLISGTATGTTTATFSIVVADFYGSTGRITLSLTPNDVVIDVAPMSLPAATLGMPYSATLSASGGVAPYLFWIYDGALPDGLTMDTQGGISGTPTAAGQASFTILAGDAAGATGLRAYMLDVSP